MKEAELLGLHTALLLPPPCSYFKHLEKKRGGNVGSGMEKVIGCGKRKQTLMLCLIPKSLLQVENCQKLHHPDVGDRCAGGFITRHGHHMGTGLGNDFRVSKTCPENILSSGALWVTIQLLTWKCAWVPLLQSWPWPPEGRFMPFPLTSYKCFITCAKSTCVSRTYALLGDRWMAYVLVGCSCSTATYLYLKSEDMLPSPSSIFNL